MPQIETMELNQKAVLWANADQDSDYGEAQVSAADEIDVRWNDTQSGGTDAQGTKVTLSAEVIVDRDITVGSVMWLGTLAAYNALGTVPTLHHVVSFDKVPDLKGRNFHRSVSLSRHAAALPTIV